MWTSLRKTFYRARGYVETDLAGQEFRTDPYHSSFWRKASAGRWEPQTFEILSRHLAMGRDYLDIGAWIGPTVLFGARHARQVIALEPDPTAYRALAWNIELNGLENVSALPVALADRVGVTRMAGMRGERGDSTTSLLNPEGEAGSDVVTLDWATFAGSLDLSDVALVKIDVEGAEFDLVPQMAEWLAKTRPAVLLSTHAPYLPKAQRSAAMARLGAALAMYDQWRTVDGKVLRSEDLLKPHLCDGFPEILLT